MSPGAFRTTGNEPPSPGRASLPSLLSRIAGGDETALNELYEQTSARVFGLASKILKDRLLAEEATLDVFKQVWERGARAYDPARAKPLPWILMLTRSRALDRLRERGMRDRALLMNAEDIAEMATELRADGPGPAELSGQQERAEQVRWAASKLPRGQREAIAAAFFGGSAINRSPRP